jgi:hypothetical protein
MVDKQIVCLVRHGGCQGEYLVSAPIDFGNWLFNTFLISKTTKKDFSLSFEPNPSQDVVKRARLIPLNEFVINKLDFIDMSQRCLYLKDHLPEGTAQQNVLSVSDKNGC